MYTTTKRLICQAKIFVLFIFFKIKIDEPKYSIDSFYIFDLDVTIHRNLSNAFSCFLKHYHNIVLALGTMHAFILFHFYVLLLLPSRGFGCRIEVSKSMKARLKVILPRIIKIALVLEIVTNAEKKISRH